MITHAIKSLTKWQITFRLPILTSPEGTEKVVAVVNVARVNMSTADPFRTFPEASAQSFDSHRKMADSFAALRKT